MICPKCGNKNLEGSTLCVKCGTSLKNVDTEKEKNEVKVDEPKKDEVKEKNANMDELKDTAMGFFNYAVSLCIKPFESFKKQVSKFGDAKYSFMFAGFVALAMMIVKFIMTMINTVFFKYGGKIVVSFDNLKYLNYLDLIIKNLIIYALVLIIVAGVYYIVALILKKNGSFTKILGVVSSAVIPYIVLGFFAPAFLSYIWIPLALVSMVAGIIYMFAIFANLMDEVVKFDNKDMKIYYHLISLTAIAIIAGLAIYKTIEAVFGGIM